MRQTMCLPRSFFRSYAAWRGPYCARRSLPKPPTRAATSVAVKPLGEGAKAITASTTLRMRALLRSMPPTMVLPTPDASANFCAIFAADEALIDAAQGIGKPLQHALQSGDHFG